MQPYSPPSPSTSLVQRNADHISAASIRISQLRLWLLGNTAGGFPYGSTCRMLRKLVESLRPLLEDEAVGNMS